MGYLDNSSVTVDAILTLKGRELLSKGDSSFNITQFALGDDEIDYNLWNPNHPLGTNYYGVAIESLPITEAIPDETQALRYKLLTLPKQSTAIPVITVGNTSITLNANASALISPNTTLGGNTQFGYTAILSDSTVADIVAVQPLANTNIQPAVIGLNQDAQSVSAIGFTFEVIGKVNTIENKTATITIIGNETGGSVTITLTVNRLTATQATATGVA
jgi:hypothetical protein